MLNNHIFTFLNFCAQLKKGSCDDTNFCYRDENVTFLENFDSPHSNFE